MIDAAIAALRQIFSPQFRWVLFKSIGMTLLFLGLAWAGLDRLALSFIVVDHPWLRQAASVAAGAGLFLLLAFFVGPLSILITGLFLDDLADAAEADIYPGGPRGAAMPALQAAGMGLRFALASAGVNLLTLPLLFVPGVNALAFLAANAYLLGREYFAFAATRYRPIAEMEEMRRRHGPTLFVAGLFIAALVLVPGLNVLTPLFGTAFMTRVHKMLSPELRALGA